MNGRHTDVTFSSRHGCFHFPSGRRSGAFEILMTLTAIYAIAAIVAALLGIYLLVCLLTPEVL